MSLADGQVPRRSGDVNRCTMKLHRTCSRETDGLGTAGLAVHDRQIAEARVTRRETAVSTPLSATSIVAPLPAPATTSPPTLSVSRKMNTPSPIAMTHGWPDCGATHHVSPANAFCAAVTGSV